MVRRQVCIQRTRNGGLGMPDMESHWLAERLAYLGRSLTRDAVWRRKASRTFPRLNSDPKAEGRRKPLGEALFVRDCRKSLCKFLGSSDFSWPRKELYRELVVGSASDPLSNKIRSRTTAWRGRFEYVATKIHSPWNSLATRNRTQHTKILSSHSTSWETNCEFKHGEKRKNTQVVTIDD